MEINHCKLSSYCTLSDFLQATETISEDLAIVGLPPIEKYNKDDPVPTVVSLINSVWALLHHRQRLIDGKRDLEQKLTVLSQELLFLKQKQHQLECALHQSEDELVIKKKLLVVKCQDELDSTKKIKSFKKEIHELNQNLKNKEWQFMHDFKRQQIEIASLQSKLRKILSKEKGEKWKGPTDGSIERKSICSNEDLLKKCIRRLENNIQHLVKENLELRKLLDGVSSEMTDLLKAQKKQEANIT